MHINFKDNFLKWVLIALFSCVVFLLNGCDSPPNQHTDGTVINGNIQFPPGSKIYFTSFADSINLFLERKSILDSALIDEKGNYSLNINLHSSCAFNLECGNKILVPNLFLSPDDNLTINFVGRDSRPVILRSRQEAKYNTFLLQLVDSFYNDPVLKPQYYIASNYMDLSQFVNYTDTRRKHQISFFNEFFKGDSLRTEFRDYAVNTIEYGIAVDRLLYLWKKRMKSETVNPDSSYFYFEGASYLENRNALTCPAYVHFLNLYIMDVYVRMLEKGTLPEDKSKAMVPQVEKFKLAVRLLNRPFRDVVLLNIISNDINSLAGKESDLPGTSSSINERVEWFKKRYSLQ